MDDWSEIRRRVLVEGVSRRQILRETKMHWRTLPKILAHSEPPGYRQETPRCVCEFVRLFFFLGPTRPVFG